MRRTLPLTLLLAAGCSGQIGNTLDDDGRRPGAGTEQCAGVAYTDTAPIRRLSQVELGNTLRSLAAELNVDGFDPGPSPLPNPTMGNWFSNNNAQNTVSQFTSEQLVEAAERASERLTADTNRLVGCSPTASADNCIREFIARFGRIALQRPLNAEETTAYANLYADIAQQDSPRSGVRAIIEATLQSGEFLYITARSSDDGNGRLRFDSHTVARRLSYFLWGTLPDAELRAAADSYSLGTAAELRPHVERMVDDVRARDTLRRFHREWLGIKEAGSLGKDPAMFPSYTNELAEDMQHEFDAFVDEIVWTQGGSVSALLTDRSAMVNGRLADFYGVEFPGANPSEWEPVTLPTNRRGILTRAAYLASHGTQIGTSPIMRGVEILNKLLCVPLTAPADVDITLPEPGPGEPPQTKRDQFAAHVSNPSCQACHSQIDPLGFAFEIYDATGSFETTYHDGDAVDSRGTMPDGRSFADATDLMDQIAGDASVAQCYSKRWVEWSLGRSVTSAEACAIAEIQQTSTTSVRDALIELATSDLMLYATPGDAQ